MVKGFHPSPNKEKVPTAAPQRGVRCPQASPPLTQERSAFTRKDLRNIPDMSDHPLSRVGPLGHDLGASYLSRSAANTGISGLPLLAIYTAKERDHWPTATPHVVGTPLGLPPDILSFPQKTNQSTTSNL
jgi:hypothetical protein